jgi:putative multiple sugar transport system substrate-binding protein
MKKLAVILVTLLVVSTVLFAQGATEQKKFIGIAMPETHVERWLMDGAALKEAAIAAGYDAEVTLGDADQTKQNAQISDFITKGADLLVIGSINEGVNSAVADARKDGVEIIAYDRMMTNTDQYDYYITFDNFKVGQFQGKAIVDALQLDKATTAAPKFITLFAGSPTDNNAFVFFDGAMSQLKPFVDKGVLKIVGPVVTSSKDTANFLKISTENWKAEIAKQRMENLLNGDLKNYTIDAVLAPNDTLARAIIEALLTDAKYAKKLPVVTGQDGELASIQYIKDGKQAMTVFKDTRLLAKAAIQLADAILKGQAPNIPGARLDTESYNTGKKFVKAYLLEPINVTKENYQKVMIDSGYYKADQIK